MIPNMPGNIVVVGAGVSGLTTALQLSRNGYSVSIVAKHMPGDYDIEYCSPWAGADYSPDLARSQAVKYARAASMSESAVEEVGRKATGYEVSTWPELERLARDVPEAGVHFQESQDLIRTKDAHVPISKDHWPKNISEGANGVPPNIRSLVNTIKPVPQRELPPNFSSGSSLISVGINTALYLPWLASQCLAHGATLRRSELSHIAAAASLHHTGQPADAVINCTGLASLRLGGVQDRALFPVRGQVVVVRNDPGRMFGASGTDEGPSEGCYIITRAAGGGTILGGCKQDGVWESQPDPNLAVRIMKRAVQLCPDLVGEGQGIEGLSVIRHGVGLRPMRTGGVRIDVQVVQGVTVVSNYGHGGAGYQTSYGCADAVVKLVNETLENSKAMR